MEVGFVIFFLWDFNYGGQSLSKIGRENVWRRGNNRTTDCSTTCMLDGRKEDDSNIPVSQLNAPADTSAIDDEDGAIFGHPCSFSAKDTSRLTTKNAQYSGSERSYASTRQVEATCLI
jgi:hypothetical protein